jgi:hypothetical protein
MYNCFAHTTSMTIRTATEEDNALLLALTNECPMPGRIGVRTNRGDNFFDLIRLRSNTVTYVAEEAGKIWGCFSVAYQNTFVLGEIKETGYLCDFKIHPAKRGTTLAHRLLLHAMRVNKRGDLYWAVSIHGNNNVKPFFNQRAGLPLAISPGTFQVYQLLPKSKPPSSVHIRKPLTEEAEEITALLNNCHKKYELAAHYSIEEIRKIILSESRVDEIYVSDSEKGITGVLILRDVNSIKINQLTSLPFSLRLTVKVSQFLSRFTNRLRLPDVKDLIRMLYVSAIAAKGDKKEIIRSLVHYGAYLAGKKHCFFLCCALYHADELCGVVRKMPGFRFVSDFHLLELNANQSLLQKISDGVPRVDFSLI